MNRLRCLFGHRWELVSMGNRFIAATYVHKCVRCGKLKEHV